MEPNHALHFANILCFSEFMFGTLEHVNIILAIPRNMSCALLTSASLSTTEGMVPWQKHRDIWDGILADLINPKGS